MKFRIDLKVLFFLALFYLTGQIKIYCIVMAFTFIHEIAHMIVGIFLKFIPQEFEIMPWGFFISLRPDIKDYKKHILRANMIEIKYIFIAMAGPAINLLFVILFGKLTNIEIETRQIIIYSNLLLFILNLIPIYPLDGGRIFRSILRILIKREMADKSINIIANISITILTIYGSIVILYLKNIGILIILAYLWELVIQENRRFELKKKVMQIS